MIFLIVILPQLTAIYKMCVVMFVCITRETLCYNFLQGIFCYYRMNIIFLSVREWMQNNDSHDEKVEIVDLDTPNSSWQDGKLLWHYSA